MRAQDVYGPAGRLLKRCRHETAGVLAGFVAVGGLMGFLEIAEDTAEGDTQDTDHRVLASLRAGGDPTNPVGPEWLEIAAADITSLGSIAVLFSMIVLVSGFLASLRRFGSATLLWASFAIGIGLSQFLKVEFGRDRPEEAYRVVDGLNASFPSGHAMLSGIVYFTMGALLARVLTQRWQRAYVLTSVVLLTALVGASRVYLGVHWMSDVIGGWALGLTVAMACWLLAHLLERQRVWPSSSQPVPEAS